MQRAVSYERITLGNAGANADIASAASFVEGDKGNGNSRLGWHPTLEREMGVRIYGLGCRLMVQGLGFRVWGSGSGDQDLPPSPVFSPEIAVPA